LPQVLRAHAEFAGANALDPVLAAEKDRDRSVRSHEDKIILEQFDDADVNAGGVEDAGQQRLALDRLLALARTLLNRDRGGRERIGNNRELLLTPDETGGIGRPSPSARAWRASARVTLVSRCAKKYASAAERSSAARPAPTNSINDRRSGASTTCSGILAP
jgi:hypothetical protein